MSSVIGCAPTCIWERVWASQHYRSLCPEKGAVCGWGTLALTSVIILTRQEMMLLALVRSVARPGWSAEATSLIKRLVSSLPSRSAGLGTHCRVTVIQQSPSSHRGFQTSAAGVVTWSAMLSVEVGGLISISRQMEQSCPIWESTSNWAFRMATSCCRLPLWEP